MSNSTLTFLELVTGEELLTDPSELYFRQCNPQFITNGQPTSQIFGNFPSTDFGRLSGARSSASTPESAYKFHTENLDQQSAGTWAVSVSEVISKQSRIIDDTNSPTTRPPAPCPPGHSYIDMRHLTNGERKRLRSHLVIAAKNRGRLHPDDMDLFSSTDSTLEDIPFA